MLNEYKKRKTSVEVSDMFLKRSSSRAFDPNKPIDDVILKGCFEAARFAPSSFNNQPWRYLVAKKGSQTFEKIVSSMVEFNQLWAKDAPVLIVVISKNIFEHNQKPSPTAPLDTGASYMSFCLEAYNHGLITHAMAGFSKDVLNDYFKISPPFEIQCLLAVGYKGDENKLPKEIKDKEVLTLRKNLDEIVCEDQFRFT